MRWTHPVIGALLAVGGIGLTLLLSQTEGEIVFAVFCPFIVLAGIYLPSTWLLWVYTAYAIEIFAVAAVRVDLFNGIVAVVSLGTGMAVMLWMSLSRESLGLQAVLSQEMFVDLRDRISVTSKIPPLPAGWTAEVSIQPAYGDSFAGDFVVGEVRGTTVDLVLLDVSGKGTQAGNRALALSGTVGGLLGELSSDKFLPALNDYLERRDTGEGFATAVHLNLDTVTGEFSIGSAGHPPAAVFRALSGRWNVLTEKQGPILGIIRDVDFPRLHGRLEPGDAVVLYTDGVIETPDRGMEVAMDRFLGMASGLVPVGFAGGAELLCSAGQAGQSDDRAVVMVWRD